MPFDFKKFDAECALLDAHALQLKWEHYTRQISGAATSTAVSGLAVPFTFGVSGVGICLSGPAIHNARKKREIIEKHLQRLGTTHQTRKRDVFTAGAISGGVGLLTLGLAPIGAEGITNSAAEHGISSIAENELGVKVATHFALDAATVAAEEVHMQSKEEHEAWKAYEKAVKEGKNPRLPGSHLNLPAHISQSPDMRQDGEKIQVPTTPAIAVVQPSAPQYTSPAGTPYFPPPPGQTTTSGTNLGNRRHSTSYVSGYGHGSIHGTPEPRPENQSYFGAPTSISTPAPEQVSRKNSVSSTPAIAVASSPQPQSNTPVESPYFPPPPGQTTTIGTNSHNRRYSASTLSVNTYETKHGTPEPQVENRFYYGTTTAISAPMRANQTYQVELPRQPADPSTTPLSATPYTNTAGEKDPAQFLSERRKSSNASYLQLPPPPPYPGQPGPTSPIQYQPPPQPVGVAAHLASSMASLNVHTDAVQEKTTGRYAEYTPGKPSASPSLYFPPPPTSDRR